MAQNAAGSAQAAPRARPHPSRVVPAIPHALTAKHRAARSRPQPSPQPTAAPSTPSPVDAPPATATVATGPADEESTNGVATPTISSSTPQPPNPATQATGAAGVARLEDDKVEAGASVGESRPHSITPSQQKAFLALASRRLMLSFAAAFNVVYRIQNSLILPP